MGLLSEPLDIDAIFRKGPWKEDEIGKAQQWLGLIYDAFEIAKKTSNNFKLALAKPADLEILEPSTELDKAGDPLKRLVLSMRTIARKRQKHTSIGNKISWALYRKAEFESLIEMACGLVSNLVELFLALH